MYNYTWYVDTKDGYEIEINLDYNISGEDGTELTTYNEKIVAIRDENGVKCGDKLVNFWNKRIARILSSVQNKLEAELWEDYDKHLDDMAS